MKISKSKQELARIISENGGWRDGAEWAAQQQIVMKVEFWRDPRCIEKTKKPENEWVGYGHMGDKFSIPISKLMPSWHQTILSCAEYFHLYPAPDADGWIEWRGGDCPVDFGALIDVKYRDGHFQYGCRAGDRCDAELYATTYWGNSGSGSAAEIIAYRLHKPEQKSISSDGAKLILVVNGDEHKIGQGVEVKEIDWFSPDADALIDGTSVIKEFLSKEPKPTIEQLAADYRNAKDYALRLQDEANNAWTAAEKAKGELIDAGRSIGIDIQPITAKQEPDLVITDWRDLRVGDFVECIKANCMPEIFNGMAGEVTAIDFNDTEQPVRAHLGDNEIWCHEVKFIRRP